jgi:hypothetical protein
LLAEKRQQLLLRFNSSLTAHSFFLLTPFTTNSLATYSDGNRLLGFWGSIDSDHFKAPLKNSSRNVWIPSNAISAPISISNFGLFNFFLTSFNKAYFFSVTSFRCVAQWSLSVDVTACSQIEHFSFDRPRAFLLKASFMK